MVHTLQQSSVPIHSCCDSSFNDSNAGNNCFQDLVNQQQQLDGHIKMLNATIDTVENEAVEQVSELEGKIKLLEARLISSETAEKAAKQRVVDIEKQTQLDIKTISTSLENAIASRKAAESRNIELQQARELADRESARNIATVLGRVNMTENEAKRTIAELEGKLEIAETAQQGLELQVAEYQHQLEEARETNEFLNSRIVECHHHLEEARETNDFLNSRVVELEKKLQKYEELVPKGFPDPKQQAGVLLLNAARRGEVDKIQKILQQDYSGVNMIESQDEEGNRALMLSAKYGHADAVKVLLDYGAKLEAKNVKGYTALLLGVDRGHHNVVKVLLDNGANINVQEENGYTPVMCACYRGNTGMVCLLLRRNAATTAKLPTGENITLLEMARQYGKGEIVQLLRNRGIRF